MSEHRFTRRVIGVTAITALGALGASSLIMGHDGEILTAVVVGIVAVVTATLRKIE